MARNDEVYHWSGALRDEAGRYTIVQRGFVNPATSGNTLAVAGVAGSKIRVLSAMAIAGAAVAVKFQSNVTDISAVFPLAQNGGFVMPRNQDGWMDTLVGDPLNVNLSITAPVGVQFTYVVIPVP